MNKGEFVSFADDFELKKAVCKLVMRACFCGFLLFLLNGLILLSIDKYFNAPDWLFNLLFCMLAAFDILLLVPFCLNKRMIKWVENNKVKPEPPKITYDLGKDNTPVAKEYSNSEDCKLYISIYNNEATVWMLQNGNGKNTFHGDINLCLREVSKYWNKCQIRIIPACPPEEHRDIPNWKVEFEYEKPDATVTAVTE